MEIVFQKIHLIQEKLRTLDVPRTFGPLLQLPMQVLQKIRILGFVKGMGEYEKRKLGVFNQLNFFQLLTGIFIPVSGLVNTGHIPASAWVVACLPAGTSAVVLYLNQRRKYEAALLTYFIAYPEKV